MPRHQSLAGSLLRAGLALVGLIGTAQAQVSCFVSIDPAIYALQLMSSRDAKSTLPRIDSELNATRGLPQFDLNRTASLYAVRATAYQVLEQRYGVATRRLASLVFLIMRNVADGLRMMLAAMVFLIHRLYSMDARR